VLVMTTDERLLSTDTATAVIDAPIARVDIAEWVFHLHDAEYQRCAPGQHIAAGVTTTDDGRPMSINVEQIAGTLLVQHYVPDVLEPHRCVLVSQTDVVTPRGRTTFQITWELSAEADGDGRCTYTNTVSAHATDAFLSFLDEQGIGVERGAAERQKNMTAHNQLETPLFAKSIERRASRAPASGA
jgi:uncharacterized protein YndB with AHSA1/START domain